MAVNRALGTLAGPFYFINKEGLILLPMGEENAKFLESAYRRKGYELRQVTTLSEWDRLEGKLQEQEEKQIEWELERDERVCEQGRKRVQDALFARSISKGTSAFEREFIKLYLQLRPEKREKYKQRWLERQSYFEALHFDSGHEHLQEQVDKIEFVGKR